MTPSSMDLSNMEQLQNSKIQLHLQPSERTYDELTDAEKIHEGCDIKATKIVLQGLPQDIYNMVTHHMPRETIHSYYIQFAQFINDMHTIGMTMQPCQVNTKFINHLQREWSKFVTDVKLAKDMHNTNFDHLYAYLRQHEAHANEVRLMRQRFLDPLAIVATKKTFLHICTTKRTQFQQRIYRCISIKFASQLSTHHKPALANLVLTQESEHKYQDDGYGCRQSGETKLRDNEDIVTTIQASQEIPTTAIFKTNDLDAFDSDCNEAPSASAILMAKLSAYDSDVLSEVPHPDTYLTSNVIDQSVTRDVQYLNETENVVVQDTNSSAQQDAMLMSVIDEMSIQVAKCRKAYLLEDKQIPSVGVFDEVFSTWMAFGGNTRDLGSFGEETDKITNLHKIHEEVLFTERGDVVAGIKQQRHDLSSDGVRDITKASGHGRLKEELESSM
ncbi:hypothetical protein Tco_0894454 [Tanacetum coccineum]|uniref:Integrase, catalytic region, zinc finger, CCHC-type, peptidase aspartic, catalytic n=1 Tax=Tanacetum coccineum TaxID=301880 RepID=A0ABQ5CD83_9ASTR